MLAETQPTGKSGAEDARIAPADPRVSAFARLCIAVDRHDHMAAKLIVRDLRALGFSVVSIKAKGQEDGR